MAFPDWKRKLTPPCMNVVFQLSSSVLLVKAVRKQISSLPVTTVLALLWDVISVGVYIQNFKFYFCPH